MARLLDALTFCAIPRVGAPRPVPGRDAFVVSTTELDPDTGETRDLLYLIASDGTTAPRALLPDTLNGSSPVPSPDGRTVAFIGKVRGDSAPPQLYVLALDGREPRRLTSFESGAADPRWFPDGRRVCVVAQVRDRQIVENDVVRVIDACVYRYLDRWLTDRAVTHLFAIDLADGSARDLMPGTRLRFPLQASNGHYDVSPDGERIVFVATEPDAGNELRIRLRELEVGTRDVRAVTDAFEGDAIAPRFSRDGTKLVFGFRPPGDHIAATRLALCDRRSGAITLEASDWDGIPREWAFDDDGGIVGCADLHGATVFYRAGVSASGISAPIVHEARGSVHDAVVVEHGVTFARVHSMSSPPEIARLDTRTTITSFTGRALHGVTLGQARMETFSGADGDPVVVHVVLPPRHDATRALPLVHVLHGGPHAMAGDAWAWRFNPHVLAAAGYVVAVIEFHGSCSFGERFTRSIVGDWTTKPTEDVLRVTDQLVARGLVDGSRVAAVGGSYGGYLACWLAATTRRVRCVVAHAPVVDPIDLWAGDVTEGYDVDLGARPWGDDEERGRLTRAGITSRLDAYTTPTLLSHGERDFRVLPSESAKLYGILRARGTVARLLSYPHEGHSLTRPKAIAHWYEACHEWLALHLRDAPAQDGTSGAV
jgi:dipeptidyl aminopeptidase/acylaminoacyl peptidase